MNRKTEREIKKWTEKQKETEKDKGRIKRKRDRDKIEREQFCNSPGHYDLLHSIKVIDLLMLT